MQVCFLILSKPLLWSIWKRVRTYERSEAPDQCAKLGQVVPDQQNYGSQIQGDHID